MNQAQTLAVKRSLKRAWNPFFGRFGRLLDPQMAAIPHVLVGRDVFLSAATASGKTEALVAPLAELVAGETDRHLSVVYVAPTRALVNDIERRCRPSLEDMGLTCRVRTGDRREFSERSPSSFLITTPESFDSLLSRRPDLFRALRALVLDELHLVDKTYRGDQLRLVARRLRALVPEVQICATSATLEDPEGLAAQYSSSPVVLPVPGGREIEVDFVATLGDVVKLLRSQARSLRKILAFANSRHECEEVAQAFSAAIPDWPVFVHHGSLDRSRRERVEFALREQTRWLCMATMTLEVGIDIGDVDAVLLLEPPLSVASLLQRIGRANRRASVVHVIALAANAVERTLYDEQFQRAREGMLDERKYEPDLSVVIQQSFAMTAGAPGGFPDERLRAVFSDYCEDEVLEAILEHLVETDCLRLTQGLWYATEAVMDLAERGQVYSNIGSSFSRGVIDAATGQRVGEVSDVVDTVFALGGNAWRVIRHDRNAITVAPATTIGRIAIFHMHTSQAAFARYLPTALHNRPPSKSRQS